MIQTIHRNRVVSDIIMLCSDLCSKIGFLPRYIYVRIPTLFNGFMRERIYISQENNEPLNLTKKSIRLSFVSPLCGRLLFIYEFNAIKLSVVFDIISSGL